jgi:broad specificity phosphatase PhoE
MRYVYIARHGQSTWNAEGRWAGRMDVPLTALGQEQALAAAAGLRDFGFRAVYSSALSRSRRTAEIIASHLGLPFGGVLAGFNERDVGVLSGLTSPEIDEKFPGLLDSWRHQGTPVEPPGGEPWGAFVERVRESFTRIQEERCLLVAHAGVLRAVAGILAEEPRRSANLEGRWVSLSDNLTLGAEVPRDLNPGVLGQGQ